MPYVEEVMETGEWSVSLKPETPESILDQIDLRTYAFASIVVAPGRVDTADYADWPTPIRYAGVYLEQSDDRLTLSGESLAWWLGDEDNGDMYVGATGTTLDLAFDAMLDARVEDFANELGVSVSGPITDKTRTLAFEPGTTRRQFLDTIIGLYPGGPYEWDLRVVGSAQPNVFVARRGSLWPTLDQPDVILAPDGGYGVTAGTRKFLSLDGTGDYAEAPDAAALDVTGDIDIRARIRLTDYTSGAVQTLVSKWNTTGNQRAYRFDVTATGELRIIWSTNGTATASETSSGASFTDGTDYWVRVTLDVSNGGNRVATFYYSTDTTNAHEDVTWTTIDTNTTAGTTSIFASTAVARISGIVGSTLDLAGRVYAAAILDGIGDAGTVVADPNFGEWSTGATSQSDDAGRTWTLNGNAYIAGTDSTAVVGLPSDLQLESIDVRDYRTHVTVGDPDTLVVGNAVNTPPATWAALFGATPVLRSFVSKSPRARFTDRPRRWSAKVGGNKYAAWVLNSATQATTFAQRVASSVNSYDYTVTAEVDVSDVSRHIVIGDYVYVWDHRRGLVDLSNEVEYRGEPAHPIKLRVQRKEVPIGPDVSVLLRTYDGADFNYVDLTEWVDPEEGPATLDLGTRRYRHRPNSRPVPINRKRLAGRARNDYRWSRFTQTPL